MARTVGQLVQAAREARGWSQTELAAKIGRSRGYVGQLESDRINLPRPELVDVLVRVLGLDREEVLRAAGRLQPADDRDILAEMRKISALPSHEARIAALRDLPPDVLQLMEDLAVDAARRSIQQQLGLNGQADQDTAPGQNEVASPSSTSP